MMHLGKSRKNFFLALFQRCNTTQRSMRKTVYNVFYLHIDTIVTGYQSILVVRAIMKVVYPCEKLFVEFF